MARGSSCRSSRFRSWRPLLERPGEIVSKEELKDRIWSEDTFVDFDRSLATAVSKLRSALGDSASRPRLIETVPKRGYRFLALNAGRLVVLRLLDTPE